MEFSQRFFRHRFDAKYCILYNVPIRNKYSDAIIKIVNDESLPVLDNKTVHIYFPEKYLRVVNPCSKQSPAYNKMIQFIKDFDEKWQPSKWNPHINLNATINIFQLINCLYEPGREWNAAMSVYMLMLWFIMDDLWEFALADIVEGIEAESFTLELSNFQKNVEDLYTKFHLESKPQKWFKFTKPEYERRWQWLFDVHYEFMDIVWRKFNDKIVYTSPFWFQNYVNSFVKFFDGWRREQEFILTLHKNPNKDFSDIHWATVRHKCQGVYPMCALILPFDWPHGLIDFDSWGSIAIDLCNAFLNDTLSFIKEKYLEKTGGYENIVAKYDRQLQTNDSEAMAYGAAKLKYYMIEVDKHLSYMDEKVKAWIEEYRTFQTVALSQFITFSRYHYYTPDD